MSITLELPSEIEATLAAEAAERGLSLSEYIVHTLSTVAQRQYELQTGAQLVEYWQGAGLIGSRTDITDSQAHARRLREQAERRRQA
jgi:hypothetical protein